jgi:AraC-like DNA-binding protein
MNDISGGPHTRVFETPGGRFTVGGAMLQTREAEDAPSLSGQHAPVPYRWCLNYVVQGNGTYQDDSGEIYELGPGTAFQRVPGRWHKTVIAPVRYAECYFHISADLHSALCDAGLTSAQPPVTAVANPGQTLKAARSLYEALAPNSSGDWHEVFQRLVALLSAVAHGAPAPDAPPAWMERARQFIIEHAADRITVGDMAEHVGMPQVVFSREFKKHVGCPPGRFLIRRRIDFACNLLRTNTVKSVAYRLGYPDPKTFSKQFHKYAGMPPSRFQKRELGR